MVIEIKTPKSCDDCIFCYDGIDCTLADKHRDEWEKERQSYCPFDNDGKTIKADGISLLNE